MSATARVENVVGDVPRCVEIKVEGVRYVVRRNEAEAENDRKDREAIVAALDAQLRKGDKAGTNETRVFVA